MRILLIRHGQTPCNITGQLDTAFPGAGLTELGHSQAAALPRAFTEHRIAAVYASKLIRTQLTGAPLAAAHGHTIAVVEGLEEISAGDFEMRSDPQSRGAYVECLLDWIRGDLARRMPGGCDGREFLARFDAALATIARSHAPEETAVAFSHGAAIRVYTAIRSGLDATAGAQLQIMNTGGALLEGDPAQGWKLSAWYAEPIGGAGLDGFSAQDVTGATSLAETAVTAEGKA
ncbi:histidine phosphatase family protein [Sinomonas sp. ASV322]|uniref:histidine phosphatase family protein n=1 Tax=Sinomonas sp. ASV322 TaxID=3041920 RepID=UPI0027DDD59F|nr:histidine phosphatase family protein [Sinomonas sp. ASV322]MDQ4503134.1 histidine phosphatase family protein [Sinomonas sp. ASV322]